MSTFAGDFQSFHPWCIYTLSLCDWLTALRSFGVFNIFKILRLTVDTSLAFCLFRTLTFLRMRVRSRLLSSLEIDDHWGSLTHPTWITSDSSRCVLKEPLESLTSLKSISAVITNCHFYTDKSNGSCAVHRLCFITNPDLSTMRIPIELACT